MISFGKSLNNCNNAFFKDELDYRQDNHSISSIFDLDYNDVFNKKFYLNEFYDELLEKNDEYNNHFFIDKYSFSNDFNNTGSKKTEAETNDFLNKKTKRKESESNKFNGNSESKEEKENTKTKEAIYSKPKGRKKKGDKPNEGSHDKNAKDNLVRKIKTFIFQCILRKLNSSFKEIKPQNCFYRLDKSLNENIKKDFNENLLKSKLKDIYKYPHLDNKYKKKDEHNRELIDKIYKEKTEIEVINILEKTFKDILNDIREKNLEVFLDEIRKKELKNNSEENVEKYLKAITNMLFYYEDWFDFKIERKPRNTNNK